MSEMPQAASASPMPDSVTNPNYRPLPGRLGNLTVIQLHILEKFKKELKEEGHFVEERMDDAMLLRFLRARKFDIIKAKEMLLDCEKWRVEFGVEDIVKNFNFKELEVVNKYYPQYYHKTDMMVVLCISNDLVNSISKLSMQSPPLNVNSNVSSLNTKNP